MKPLTEQQAKVLAFIAQHIAEHGAPPAIREVCAHMGISSPNGVMCHVRALRKKGYLEPARDTGDKVAVARDLMPAGLRAKLAAVVKAHMKELNKGAGK